MLIAPRFVPARNDGPKTGGRAQSFAPTVLATFKRQAEERIGLAVGRVNARAV